MKRFLTLALSLTAFFALPLWGQERAVTDETVEAFFDNAWENSLSVNGVVPGAVVTVVSRDGILLNKGYGTRDMDTGEPADADVTRLRIGSTSKLFTALTTLALVDEEKLVLDANVNAYPTGVKVPDTFADPVTVRSLLSHLSGFDAQLSGFMVEDNNAIGIEPQHYRRILRRLRPVGREYGYDNTGLGLLGYLIAQVSGRSFAEEVERTVLAPLGMRDTAMGVPDRQLEHLAACHSWDKEGNAIKCQHKFMRAISQGAGDISTTGADMARFMRALLNGGCLDGRCILRPETFAAFVDMDQNRFHPEAQGLGFVMMEADIGGHHAIGHGGGQDGYSTSMSLFPEAGIGIFVSQFSYVGIPAEDRMSVYLDMFSRMGLVNTYGAAGKTIGEFAETFLPKPVNHREQVSAEFVAQDLSPLAGVYAGTRQISATLHSRILRALGTFQVVVKGDEVFIADKGPFKQAGERVLAAPGEKQRWFYEIRNDGHVLLQNADGAAISMFAKQPWHYQAKFVVLPVLLPLLLAVPALLVWLLGSKTSPSRPIGKLSALIGAALLIGLYLEFEYYSANYFPEGPTLMLMAWRLLINLAWLAALYLLYRVVNTRALLFQFVGPKHSAMALLNVLLVVSALVVVILIPYWGLLGNFSR